jgi:hypothetical protein
MVQLPMLLAWRMPFTLATSGKKIQQFAIQIGPKQAPLDYFPFDGCYSRRNWDLLVRVAMLINRELPRSFLA